MHNPNAATPHVPSVRSRLYATIGNLLDYYYSDRAENGESIEWEVLDVLMSALREATTSPFTDDRYVFDALGNQWKLEVVTVVPGGEAEDFRDVAESMDFDVETDTDNGTLWIVLPEPM